MNPGLDEISERFDVIRSRIALAEEQSGRPAGSVAVLAVSKRQPLARILSAFDAGQRLFGESYVQEALEKLGDLGESEVQRQGKYRLWRSGDDERVDDCLKFDFIGRLQSNKIKKIVGTFRLIHSIDRLSTAEHVARAAQKLGITQQVLVQVNVFDEETKGGFSPEAMKSVLEELLNYDSLHIRGLMSFGKFVPSTASYYERAQEFKLMCNLRGSLQESLGVQLPELSMGVSHDFEVAIREGATIVRIGTDLFGQRD